MDVFAHALWTTGSALIARRASKRPIRLLRAAAWGVLPDLASFTIPAAVRIWRVSTRQSSSLLPDGRGPRFDWVWDLYNASHSAVIFAIVFAGFWLVLRRPVLEMLGWALHIFIDVFTHSGLFSIQFLWPLSAIHVDGIRWEAGRALIVNYSALASFYFLLLCRGLIRMTNDE